MSKADNGKTFLEKVRTSTYRAQNYENATGGAIPYSMSPEMQKVQDAIVKSDMKKHERIQ